MSDFIQVTTAIHSEEGAQKIAWTLAERRLAACMHSKTSLHYHILSFGTSAFRTIFLEIARFILGFMNERDQATRIISYLQRRSDHYGLILSE